MERCLSVGPGGGVGASLAVPVSATVHGITGIFCAGDNGKPFPAGMCGGSNADDFAKPLFATGFVGVGRALCGRR